MSCACEVIFSLLLLALPSPGLDLVLLITTGALFLASAALSFATCRSSGGSCGGSGSSAAEVAGAGWAAGTGSWAGPGRPPWSPSQRSPAPSWAPRASVCPRQRPVRIAFCGNCPDRPRRE
jgi:hypothetical protein